MDYDATDKGILRKVTTEALSRVMRLTETNLGELRMALQGADILYRESATDWSRRNFFNLQSMISNRITQLSKNEVNQ